MPIGMPIFLNQMRIVILSFVLSHLGYSYKGNKLSDLKLADKVDNVDVIIGGHTHTFLDCPNLIEKPEKKFVIVNQVGFGGITLGKLDIYFDMK
jgi:5'-nucleotidase